MESEEILTLAPGRRHAEVYFGDVVRRRRMELGLTQEELGVRLSRDATRVSKVESGHTFRRMPSAEEFREWAEALEIDPALILEQMGYINPDQTVGTESTELIFTTLENQVRYSSNLPEDVKEVILDGIKHAQRLWLAKQSH